MAFITCIMAANITLSKSAGTGYFPMLNNFSALVLFLLFNCSKYKELNIAVSFSVGLRQIIRRKALCIFSFGEVFSCKSLAASTLDASNTIGLFIIINACKGVFVRCRCTSHWSRLLASKMPISTGGTVRLIKVYMPRRYKLAPCDCLYLDKMPRPEVAASHNPGG